MKVLKMTQVAEITKVTPLFTGPVTMQTFVGLDESELFSIQQVNFAPGVRNKFHSHTIEQVLIVTKGKGIVATETEEVVVTPGDVIFVPAGEKHWHGATPDSAFSHLYVMSPKSKTTQLEP
jgi:quercetin dioxygenase-like cupin family protein